MLRSVTLCTQYVYTDGNTLCVLILDVLQAYIGRDTPWVMSFADDLVICEHSRTAVELQLERWRDV